MQVLIFHLGQARVALPSALITQVLPMLATTAIPGAPAFVAGLINYHGRAVPVLDLEALAGGAAARARLDTRILLVEYPSPEGSRHALGLIAEGVTGTARITAENAEDSGLSLPQAPYLGRVVSSSAGILQLIELSDLLPQSVRDLLFQAQVPAC